MSEAATALAQTLRTESDRTCALFRALTPDRWSIQVYQDGATWTVRDLLYHFIHVEGQMFRIVEDIKRGGAGSPEIDIDPYNAKQTPLLAAAFVGQSEAALIERFAAEREKLAAFTVTFTDADLARQGRHPTLGIMTLNDLIRVIYLHLKVHGRDIKRALEAAAVPKEG